MLKIQSDRIIIDGHEPTKKKKEQCETMTLLANALAGSESFKTTTPAVTENSDGSVDLKI